MFDFVFKMFSEGGISLPAKGIRAVPEQLAESLPPGRYLYVLVQYSLSSM